MTIDLFESSDDTMAPPEILAPGAMVLRGHATADAATLLAALDGVLAQAPFRHMVTPGGFRMSVAMTNCGAYGWITGITGYRYGRVDPDSGRDWPPTPAPLLRLATRAAAQAGYSEFVPDACLINRYVPGTRLSLHQDKDEADFTAPVVSVSLGLPAIFLFGGMRRADTTQRVTLLHGDVVVWGGAARLRYHGVLPLKAGHHVLLGEQRINLTFRKAA